ncbi:MAG TPA: hypothetical protein VGZ03_11225 [Acidimicrobiales bacterium]|nr:hypothetical protein [Acidimicrobiales bacterium]
MSTPRDALAPADGLPAPSVRRAAIEVSALRGGSHAAAEFVAFALAALRDATDLEPIEWSVRALRRSDLGGARVRRAVPARLGERAASLGVPVTTRWASPPSDVVFLAGGPLALRAVPPGVVTVLHHEPGDADPRGRRRLERLGRAAAEGTVVHAPTHAAADLLAGTLRIEPASIAVAVPGVRAAGRADTTGPPSAGVVVVLDGVHAARDRAVLDALRAAGASAQRASSPAAVPHAACCVLASPSSTFPIGALEALTAGIAVVAARSPTTTELLEGAATLVDAAATQEFVDAAMGLCANEHARAIALAAGAARAADFTWGARADDLVAVVRRALRDDGR